MSALDRLLQLAPKLADGMVYGPGHVMVRCPFHGGGEENTPSMSISMWKPVYFCFGCKCSGHISQLLRRYGMSTYEIEILIPRNSYQQEAAKNTTYAKLARGADLFRGSYILNEEILDRYRLKPNYLINAGFREETLLHFEVGFDSTNFRTTFPLRSVFGELLGISGRALWEGNEPRYKIYDRELKNRTDFHIPDEYSMEEAKSSVLWHAHVIRPMFLLPNSGKEEIVITEGFKACMWTFQAGFEDTVALVGSYLTPNQAELLARASRRATLFLDNNKAGWMGTRYAGIALLKKGVEVCVAKYPDEREQPDDLTDEEVLQAIRNKESFRSWVAQHPQHESIETALKRIRKAR